MGYVLVGIVLVTLLSVVADRWRKKRSRREHAKLNRLMSGEKFVQAVGAAAAGAASCRVRGVIAAAMGVPPATLLPSDKWSNIGQFIGFDGMDFANVELILEKQMDIRIPHREWKRYWTQHGNKDFATLIRFLAEQKCLSPAGRGPQVA